MCTRRFLYNLLKRPNLHRNVSFDSEYPPEDHPYDKIKRRLAAEKEDIKTKFSQAGNFIFNVVTQTPPKMPVVHPSHVIKDDRNFPFDVDILIVGGGLMGLSTAYWLSNFTRKELKICVLEQDLQYTSASSPLSLGGIRQQFTLAENVQMSMFGAHFLKNSMDYFDLPLKDISRATLDFQPQGYLLLASEDNLEAIYNNYYLQREYGSHVKLLSSQQLQSKFPWLNVDGLGLCSYGIANEGWFNPWQLMMNFKTYNVFWDVDIIHGQLLGIECEKMNKFYDPYTQQVMDYNRAVKAICNVWYADGTLHRKKIQFCKLVNAMGPHAARLAEILDIGSGEYGREIPLPVEPRKRYVYVVKCTDGPILDMPFLVDTSGLTIRRVGLDGTYLVLLSPQHEVEEPQTNSTEVDYSYFYNVVWPLLAHRIPCFKNLQLINGWSGLYDYNFVDQNPVIGRHPWHDNLFFANGFSGNGAQHSPAVGRAITELILYNSFQTIDLRKFGFERFADKSLVHESHAI